MAEDRFRALSEGREIDKPFVEQGIIGIVFETLSKNRKRLVHPVLGLQKRAQQNRGFGVRWIDLERFPVTLDRGRQIAFAVPCPRQYVSCVGGAPGRNVVHTSS